MKSPLNIDFSCCQVVDSLWPQFVESIGFEKTKLAVNQALDIQRMNGNKLTIPVLIIETCGLALANIDAFYLQTGILCDRKGIILLLSLRYKKLQLIYEN